METSISSPLNIVILANGQYPTHRHPLASIATADIVVCCDGAIVQLMAHHSYSGTIVVVGDGDSSRRFFEQPHPQSIKLIHIAEQESNDLSKAFHYAVGQYPDIEKITILGATGLREDHTIGNISLLGQYAAERPDLPIEMQTDYGIFTPVLRHKTFNSFARQQVSIFSTTPEVPISVDGLRYPISNRCLHLWSEGTLNESLGNRFTVDGGRLIVFQTYKDTASQEPADNDTD